MDDNKLVPWCRVANLKASMASEAKLSTLLPWISVFQVGWKTSIADCGSYWKADKSNGLNGSYRIFDVSY